MNCPDCGMWLQAYSWSPPHCPFASKEFTSFEMLKRQYSEEEIKDPSCFSLICSCCGKQQHVWTYSENSEDREKLREFCEKSFKEKYASYYKNPAPPMLMTALTPVNFEI